jgi:hypothetical protein
MLDVQKFVGELHDYIGRALSPLAARIKALEDRAPERGEAGPKGERGADGERGQQGERGVAGEKGDTGEAGPAGKDAAPVDLEALADRVVAKLLESGRIKTLTSLEAAEAVAEHFKTNPVREGKDGRDGADGKDGAAGERGPQGERGEKGADGAGIADTLIDRDGVLVATYTDGRMKALGPVVGKDGRDGKDGADGVGLEDMEPEYDEAAHQVVLRFGVAGKRKELRYHAGGVHHGGYWREGTKAKRNETWTRGGTTFIAKCDTDCEPSRDSEHWLIFASKGRDGQDGRNGRDLGPPAPVKLGGDGNA